MIRRTIIAVLVFVAVAAVGVRSASAAKPTVLLVHGGAWYYVGEAATATVEPAARRFRKLGFRTVSVDYRAGAAGLQDVADAYAATHAACIYGESAGGNLALMLAAQDPSVSCVIAIAAPTDLLDPGAAELRRIAMSSLGPIFARFSPLLYASQIRARVLLAGGDDDTLVPLEQATRLADALTSDHQVISMPPGSVSWMHGTSTASARRVLNRQEAIWLTAARRR